MKINEVEQLVGVTKRNIRFYEKEGLLSPGRTDNGYRDYGEADVEALRKIKLLRKLDVPLEEIRRMQQGTLTLTDGVRRHIIQLERAQDNLATMRSLCQELAESGEQLASLDAGRWLEKMERMEEGGTQFMNIRKNDIVTRYGGTVAAALVFVALMGGLIALMVWGLTVEPAEAPPLGLMLFLLAIPGVVIIGGIQSIASVCEKLVPFMAAFYVLGCIIILAINWDFLAPAVSTILRLAFTPGAAAGGLVGQGLMAAMRFGVARGLFSNESGMGSAPLVASAAQTRNPVRQALVSATGTFWDTVVVCLMTGLVLVTTIMKNPAIDMAQISDGGQLTTLAFAQIPVLGPVILVVGIITFAWSTILGWSYYGERCAQYLWGKRALLPYKLVFVAVVVVGPVLALDLVWTIADILNALMAIPNLVAVLLLSGVVARDSRHYLGNLDEVDQTEIPRVDK